MEPGTSTGERNATNFSELFVPGLIANYMDLWRRYTGRDEELRRYYPVIRECAEFYRHWLLVELPGNNLMTVPLIDVNESIYPVQDGPFTTASGAFLRALGRIFLYPQDDRVQLFPGVPVDWTDFAVEMPAHQGMTLAARVAGGRLIYLAVRGGEAARGRELTISVPHGWLPDALPGDEASVTFAVRVESTGVWLPVVPA